MYAVFAVNNDGCGAVVTTTSYEDASRLCELFNTSPNTDFRVSEYNPSVDHFCADYKDLLSCLHYYVYEHPDCFLVDILDSDINLVDKYCIIDPVDPVDPNAPPF